VTPAERRTDAVPPGGPRQPVDALAASVVHALAERGATVAVAESLTGGLVVAALVSVPGASAVVRGGVVAYATPLKHRLLGVDPDLLARRGAVDPDVARQMAEGVRSATIVDGVEPTWGISTTGVAGPDPQDGKPVGTVFLGIAHADLSAAYELHLDGGRSAIRTDTVSELLARLYREVTGRQHGE
jgi:nicotinamide-nucleotide amidase